MRSESTIKRRINMSFETFFPVNITRASYPSLPLFASDRRIVKAIACRRRGRSSSPSLSKGFTAISLATSPSAIAAQTSSQMRFLLSNAHLRPPGGVRLYLHHLKRIRVSCDSPGSNFHKLSNGKPPFEPYPNLKIWNSGTIGIVHNGPQSR